MKRRAFSSLVVASFFVDAVAEKLSVLRIGLICPHEAPDSPWIESALKAARMAIEEQNSRGDRQFQMELVVMRESGDQASAQRAVDGLIKESVQAVIHMMELSSIRIASLSLSSLNVPLLATTSTSYVAGGIGKFSRNTFRLIANDRHIIQHLARWQARSAPMRRLAVIDDGSNIGKVDALSFSDGLKFVRKPAEIVDSFNPTISPALEFAERIIRNGPAVIFYSAPSEKAFVLARSLSELGWDGRFINHNLFNCTSAEISGLSRMPIEFVSAQPWLDVGGHGSDMMEFRAKFRSLYGSEPDLFSAHVYDAISLIADAAARARETAVSSGAVVAEMAITKSFRGLTGSFEFDGQGELRDPVVTLYRLTSGDWRPIESFGAH